MSYLWTQALERTDSRVRDPLVNAPSTQIGFSLSGKHIVVTGGTHGIGLASADTCLAAGATVTIVARSAPEIAERVAELGSAHGSERVAGFAGDVSVPENVEAVFAEAVRARGNLHGVVHAAGIYGPIGPITEVDPAQWRGVIEVNLFGTFLVLREACRRMQASGGRIAVFSGGGAAAPFPNYTGYACSKAALVRLVETAAIEMAPFAIAINAIAPGFVKTRLHDQTLAAGPLAGGFLAKTQEVMESGGVSAGVGARAAAFLVSDSASGITGKFVAAPYDDYERWNDHPDALRDTDIFTLRRILPRERGMDWQ
jgi:3-oxoacyl-[acyl-carrier protein] reductase